MVPLPVASHSLWDGSSDTQSFIYSLVTWASATSTFRSPSNFYCLSQQWGPGSGGRGGEGQGQGRCALGSLQVTHSAFGTWRASDPRPIQVHNLSWHGGRDRWGAAIQQVLTWQALWEEKLNSSSLAWQSLSGWLPVGGGPGSRRAAAWTGALVPRGLPSPRSVSEPEETSH